MARIGGLIYRNVRCPIVVNGEPALTLQRNAGTAELGISFTLRSQDGEPIGRINNNEVRDLCDGYTLLEGRWGRSVVEEATGRVWCDLRTSPIDELCELDCSCLLLTGGYPLLLHPDRTNLGIPHGDDPPRISGLTLTTGPGSEAAALGLTGSGFYLLDIAIENFKIGINIIHEPGTTEDA